MATNQPTPHSCPSAADLPTRAWQQIERVLNRFEEAWQQGKRPFLRDFLPQVPDGQRLLLLVELIHEEIELRLRAGEAPRVEEYLRDYLELNNRPDTVLQLLAWEYHLRARRGEEVPLDEYRTRFPTFGDRLEGAIAALREQCGLPPVFLLVHLKAVAERLLGIVQQSLSG
jgi:hypothetical protein